MNDDELGRYLAHSIERRVGSVTPHVDLEELMVRTQRRLSRQRRVLVAAAVAVLVIGVLAGYVVGHAGDEHGAAVNAALDDGAPRFASPAPRFEPANVGAAMAAIDQAFHAAFDGGVDPRQKADAIQNAAGIRVSGSTDGLLPGELSAGHHQALVEGAPHHRHRHAAPVRAPRRTRIPDPIGAAERDSLRVHRGAARRDDDQRAGHEVHRFDPRHRAVLAHHSGAR